MLKIYNTIQRNKQEFKPLVPGKVGMYVCGMTVYDFCHIGHARVMVVFDVVARYLRQRFEVTYVRNVTDIDDKIIRRSAESGEPCEALTTRYIEAMHEDEKALNVLPPDFEPRATRSIDAIVSMIASLLSRGYAYIGTNGDVFYAVSRFENYGRLSGKNPEDLRAGERVEVDAAKRDPLDFVLWKMAKAGEPSWNSPWGAGRPGWHIECSAMSTQCLGNHFDIHGGGMDLQFPHHENEIAQSEAATGSPFVNYWMHNGFVRINDEKMAKSLGNFFTVREVLERYRGEVIRFFILASHYRSPLNYSDSQLDEAAAALTRLYTALRGLEPADISPPPQDRSVRAFESAMDDDFNTPVALSVLFEIAKEINRARADDPREAIRLGGNLKYLGKILGILQEDPEHYFKGGAPSFGSLSSDDEIEHLVQRRLEARAQKDWALADRIREDLKERGIILEDLAGSTTWRRG
ncbi:MAG: cysteine--tRNA ligase [Gammaproteobacteria bacterium]